MLDQIDRFCEQNKIATFSAIHAHSEWGELLHTQLDVKAWLHHSLVWQNQEYQSFDDYLESFKSKHRKNIKRDRRKVEEQGIAFEARPVDQWPADYLDRMYRFYEETCIKYWGGCQYLNRRFFDLLRDADPQRVVLNAGFFKDQGEDPIAMSFLVHKDKRLYGRYWGSVKASDGVHFEACYYAAIDYAIANGVQYYDAGSGNAAHKSRRGFPARPVYSLHRFYNPALDHLWDDNIAHVNEAEAKKIKMINGEIKSPYPIYG
jgi:predicted N-acyltransferase